MKYAFTKQLIRKGAKPVSDYNHNAEHRDHKDKTNILEEQTKKSEALERIGGWGALDSYEKANKQKNKNPNVMYEEIMSIPNEWINRPDLTEKLIDMTIDDMAEFFKFDKEKMLYEIVQHYNHADGLDKFNIEKDNNHIHWMLGLRQVSDKPVNAVYSRDGYQNKITKKFCGKNDPNAVLIYRKGEEKRDKNGNPIIINNCFSNKTLECFGWKNIYRARKFFEVKCKEHIEELDPSQKLKRASVEDPDFITYDKNGNEIYLKIKSLKTSRTEQHKNPEAVKDIKEINKEARKINETTKSIILNNRTQSIERQQEIGQALLEDKKEYLKERRANIVNKKGEKRSFSKVVEITKNYVEIVVKKFENFTKSLKKEFLNVPTFIRIKKKQVEKVEERKAPERVESNEPIYLYAWDFGFNLAIKGRGAIEYKNNVLTFINSDYADGEPSTTYELKEKNLSQEKLLKVLDKMGVKNIEKLENTSNWNEYKTLFDKLDKGIEPEMLEKKGKGRF